MTRNRELDLLAHRIDRAANTIDDIYRHLDEQRAYVSVLTANAPDGMPHGQGSHSDPTARAFHQLKRIEDVRGAITDAVATLNVCVNMLEKNCRRALSFRVSVNDDNTDHLDDQPQCKGEVVMAADSDGNVLRKRKCSQIPSPRTDPSGSLIDDGLCLDCGRTSDRQKWEADEARRRQRADRERLRYHSQKSPT